MDNEGSEECEKNMPFAIIEVGKFLVPSAHDPALQHVVIRLEHSKHFFDEDTLPSDIPDFGKLRRVNQATVYGMLKGIINGHRIGKINHPRGDTFTEAVMWLRLENIDYSGYTHNPYQPADRPAKDRRHTLTLAGEFVGGIDYYRRIFRQMEKD